LKKIGIITLPLIRNYGGILQSYALQKYLQDQGNEVVLIDRHRNKGGLTPYKEIVKKLFFRKKYIKAVEEKAIIENPTYFINKYLKPKTDKILSEEKLHKIVKQQNFDAVITGSDQVWRLEYAFTLTNNLFLDFVPENTKKISYAASFGVDTWDHDEDTTTKIKELLKTFDKVSVREDSGVEICQDVFGIQAEMLVDPTMLLKKEDYIELVSKENEPKKDGSILVYMLDVTKDRQEAIDRVCAERNSDFFRVNAKSQDPNSKLEDRIYPPVTGWLRGFMDAEFAIIDSFHGCVFSILFNVPFIAYGNVKRGLTRFTSLLKAFGLEDRLILDKNDLTDEKINAPIDWDVVNAKLEALRSKSETYLKDI